MLPKVFQARIWSTYRKGQETDKQPSAEYMAAQKAAVEVVAKLEGRREVSPGP